MAKQWDADTQSYVEEEYLMEKLHLQAVHTASIKQDRIESRLGHEQLYPAEVINYITNAVLKDEDLLDIREVIDRRMKERYGNQYSIGMLRSEFIKPVLTPITPEHLQSTTKRTKKGWRPVFSKR